MTYCGEMTEQEREDAMEITEHDNEIIDIGSDSNSEHSIYSSRIYVDAFLQDMEKCIREYEFVDFNFLTLLIFAYGYVVSMHHSKLNDIQKFVSNMFSIEMYNIFSTKFNQKQFEKLLNKNNISDTFNKINGNKQAMYILLKLLYSVLVTADYYATYEYMSGNKVDFAIKKDNELFSKYENGKLYKTIKEYESGNADLDGINKLRTEMFIETEQNLKSNLDKQIYYLEAPTGAGKTNMAINLAKILYQSFDNINSLNYIFPFNTLVEQTAETFDKYFKKYEQYIVDNSLTPMVDEKEDRNDYELLYIQNVFAHYPIKITTHINLFNTLFGTGKISNFTLYNYINSVVVLDEIQSYTNSKWRSIIYMLDKYAKLFNIKFIIMSATLPRLDKLIKQDKVQYVSLIDNSKRYYNNNIFKSRVKIDFSLLDNEIDLEILKNKVCEYKGKKILVEFITKKTAREFYNLMKSEFETCYEITGDDNNYNRKKVIDDIKIKKDILVVATQTIEAGVDIDMDVGFKDISLLDSEEQFLGRINRSSVKKDCIAYFFNIDTAEKIYKGDYRLEYNLTKANIKNILLTKQFDLYYTNVMDKLYQRTTKHTKENTDALFENCMLMNFNSIERDLKLIDNNTVQIFLNSSINIDGEVIKGSSIWKQYKILCNDYSISYAKKQIELSKIKEKFNYFIYNIFPDKTNQVQFSTERLGNIYYIENGDEFIEDGKFNRSKYEGQVGGIIL